MHVPQIDENGIFVTMEGSPLDREGLPIEGVIDPVTGFIVAAGVDGMNMTIGPNGEPLPDDSLLPPTLIVGADGVPRNASGTCHSTYVV